MNKHIELAKKLKALAERGVGGEKVNAEKMLTNIMDKHNLSIEDIEGEMTRDYFFNPKNEEIALLGQIIKRVNYNLSGRGPIPAKKVKQFGLEGNFFVTCTISEYIEIESMFDIYSKLYKEELKVFYSAFCTANDLLATGPIQKKVSDLSPNEYKEWLRVNAIASKIKSETVRKRIKQHSPPNQQAT